ncbi:MAG TPA: glycosyltransferase family 39 protein [Acidimicrobiales bacterium]
MAAENVPAAVRWWRRAFPALPPLDRRTRLALAAIVAVAAVLRVLWGLSAEEPRELRDPVLYMVLADNLADGNGYSYGDGPSQGPTAYYPPGYPLFLGGLVSLADALPGSPTTFDIAIAANVVLSTILVLLIFSLGRRLAGAPVGLTAAAVAAVWPNLVFHSGVVLTETLFLVVLTTMFLVALATPAVARRPGWLRVAAVGVLLGITVLIRPVSLVIAPLLLVLWWDAGLVPSLRRVGLALASMVLVVAPWSVLSTLRMESPVLLSLNLGDNLCIGNHPGATGGYTFPDYCSEGLGQGERPEFEVRRQSETLDRSWAFIRDEPGTVIGLVPDRARYTLRDDHDGLYVASDWGERPLFSTTTVDTLENLADGYYYLVVAGSLAGVAVLVARRRRLGAPHAWAFFVATAPVHLLSPLVTFGEPRFKMPMYPVLAVTAAVALVAAIRRARGAPDVAAVEPPGGEDGGEPSSASSPARIPEVPVSAEARG